MTFASTGRLADAYGHGVGPTAHASPPWAIFQGLVYRALGDTPAAEMTLTLVVTALGLASFYFAYRIFALLKLPPLWRLAALAFVCLVPINAMLEVRIFRGFEGMLAATLAFGVLYWVLWLAQKERVKVMELAPLALVMGLLALTNQSAALGVYGAAGWLVLRRVPWRSWPAVGAVFAVGLVVFLAPWALRNERVLGHPVFTRSNFGLEFAQAYFPGALEAKDRRAEFIRRHAEMHPMQSVEALRQVRTIGEVEYSGSMTRETMDWIKANPGESAQLAARHFQEFWFPDPWVWSPFEQGEVSTKDKVKSGFVWLITAMGLAGLALGLRRNFGGWIYVAIVLLLSSLPYVLTQPVIRYRYIVSTLLIFCAFELVHALAEKLRLTEKHSAPASA